MATTFPYIHLKPGFRAIYESRPGSPRRQALRAFFESYPDCHLAVNRKYQAHSRYDSDLAVLLKKGVLVQQRTGGSGFSRNTPLRSCMQRQTILVLNPKLARQPISR